MLLAIWNCIQVPYDIAFLPDRDNGKAEFAINQIIDMVFILDVILTFRTTYIHEETGVEVWKPSRIAAHYLKGEYRYII